MDHKPLKHLRLLGSVSPFLTPWGIPSAFHVTHHFQQQCCYLKSVSSWFPKQSHLGGQVPCIRQSLRMHVRSSLDQLSLPGAATREKTVLRFTCSTFSRFYIEFSHSVVQLLGIPQQSWEDDMVRFFSPLFYRIKNEGLANLQEIPSVCKRANLGLQSSYKSLEGLTSLK